MDVRQRLLVDQDLEALVLEDVVALAPLVEGQLVLEAGAPAAADAEAQAGGREIDALGGEELAHLLAPSSVKVMSAYCIASERIAARAELS